MSMEVWLGHNIFGELLYSYLFRIVVNGMKFELL